MSASQTVPDGLKPQEVERGNGGLKAPIRFVPERDLLGEAVEKSPRSMKLTLPKSGAEFKVKIWSGGSNEEFLNHVMSAKSAIKKLELWPKQEKSVEREKMAQEVLESARAVLKSAQKKVKQTQEAIKGDTSSDPKKQEKGKGDTTPDHKKSESAPSKKQKKDQSAPEADLRKLLAEVKAAERLVEESEKTLHKCQQEVEAAGEEIFQLYANLLAEDKVAVWDKIASEQTESETYTDVYGVEHTSKRGIYDP